MRITAEFIADLAHFNAGVKAAKLSYYGSPAPTPCPWSKCDDEHLCRQCRYKVKADLRVATSVEECGRLLALLDLPRPGRRRMPTRPCGTSAAYRRHLRHGEKACDACVAASRADSKVSNDKRAAKKRRAAQS